MWGSRYFGFRAWGFGFCVLLRVLSGIYRVQGFRVEGFGGSGPGVRGVGSLCFVGLGPTAWILDFDSEATAPLLRV